MPKKSGPHVSRQRLAKPRDTHWRGAGQRKTRMKNDTYQVVTDRIINLLEKGVVPWQKPWTAENSPKNLISLKEYRGINVFLLNAMMYESPYFLTFKQAQQLGGNVKRGEKASPVVFWKWLETKDAQAPDGTKKVPFLRYYSVFNLSQCENIPVVKIPVVDGNKNSGNPIEKAEQIPIRMPKKPVIQEGGARACYFPSLDRVDIPTSETFRSREDYYSTLYHELTHSTGHESRLNRKGVSGSEGEWSAFGSAPYAKEELVAEMGAAFLCGHAGIVQQTIENSAAYINSWMAKLKEDKKLVIQAAGQAQKASDFILGKNQQEIIQVQE